MTEATRPHLHSDTEIYAAVIALAKFCVTVARQMPRDVKQLIGANVYLDELDQFVKHRLRAPHYVRYVDDFVLLHESPRQLNAWRQEIEAFVSGRLGVQLHPAKTILQPAARGIDFCGQVIKPHRRTLRRRTFNDALHRLSRLPANEIYPSANSYLGLVRQATHGQRDRARLGRVMLRRGFSVDHQLTKVYRQAQGSGSQ